MALFQTININQKILEEEQEIIKEVKSLRVKLKLIRHLITHLKDQRERS